MKLETDRMLREVVETYKTLTLMNNLYMALFFDEQNACVEHILRVILGINDLEVVSVKVEQHLTSLDAHSACLDVLARDSTGRQYDIELQSDPTGASVKRARFYSAMLDSSILAKGARYSELPDTYVLFIVNGIVPGLSEPMCHIERVITETGKSAGDGSHIVYVNAAYNFGNTEFGNIVHDFTCADPKQMRSSVLAERAHYCKETEGASRLWETSSRLSCWSATRLGVTQGTRMAWKRGVPEASSKVSSRVVARPSSAC